MSKSKPKANTNDLISMIQGHAKKADETPQQEVEIKHKKIKKKPIRFTVDIEENLLERVREYGFKNKIRLRKIFETALEEYVSKDDVQ
jgi:hypothetical protein